MARLHLYTAFHCNLAFSSIDRASFPTVVERCYWPLLRLAEDGFPIALEMTAWTLKEVNAIDPAFVDKLKELWDAKKLEFIGSGYSQAIFPLIPTEVNRWNLEAGNRHYREILGRRPEVALVNEQTYSRGLVDLYKEAGYRSVIMDWNNSQKHHNYPKEHVYFPQRAAGLSTDIEVLWSHSIAFQKFQRLIHGGVSMEEYMDFLGTHCSEDEERSFVLYTNDAEVFDFRPGGEEVERVEWTRIREVLSRIREDRRFILSTPGRVSELFKNSEKAGKRLSLESVETPVVCKKQDKYNPTRWAVAGRDSVHINTECYRVYKNISKLMETGALSSDEADEYKELVADLWGSDFRTHTIDEKFQYFQNRLGWLKTETERLLKRAPVASGGSAVAYKTLISSESETARPVRKAALITKAENSVVISTPTVEAEFLPNKGFAVRRAVFPGVSREALIGTIPHGYYDDIRLGADFFTGHIIHVARDGKKTTDLRSASMEITEDDSSVALEAKMPIDIGFLTKRYEISKIEPSIALTLKLKVNGLLASSLRLGIFTFLPGSFDSDTLWYESVNGGAGVERFYLKGKTLSHDEPVSHSVTASSCLGSTDGRVRIGDRHKAVEISTDKAKLFSVAMLKYMELNDEGKFFLRLQHSVGEVDDTAWWVWKGINEVSFRIRALKGDEE
ncbi:MAG: hypothetical protein HYV24_08940 [Deltaproteobacteria bacterium]|nr:hypothetical protein [Deltaproteobacteria bacterium]